MYCIILVFLDNGKTTMPLRLACYCNYFFNKFLVTQNSKITIGIDGAIMDGYHNVIFPIYCNIF